MPNQYSTDIGQLNSALAVLEREHNYYILNGETCCRGCAFGFFESKYEKVIRDVDGTDLKLRMERNAEGGINCAYYTEQSNVDSYGNFTSPFYLHYNGDIDTICLVLMYNTDFVITVPESEDEAILIETSDGQYSNYRVAYFDNDEEGEDDSGGDWDDVQDDEDQFDDQEDCGRDR